MLSGTQQVQCTNCGQVGPAFYLTLAALLIAAIALFFSYQQHHEFLRRLRARAKFKVTLKPLAADADGAIPTEGTTGTFRVEIGIKNEGDRAAGQTLINVLFPRGKGAVWCGPNGESREPRTQITSAGEGDVVIDPSGGTKFEAEYISRTLDRVGTRPHHTLYFQFTENVPDEGEVRVPLRVKVQADEIPPEIEEYEEELVVRIRRGRDIRT